MKRVCLNLLQNNSTVTAENERDRKTLLVRSEQENTRSVWKTCRRIRSNERVNKETCIAFPCEGFKYRYQVI